jgi:hypothetical protein
MLNFLPALGAKSDFAQSDPRHLTRCLARTALYLDWHGVASFEITKEVRVQSLEFSERQKRFKPPRRQESITRKDTNNTQGGAPSA